MTSMVCTKRMALLNTDRLIQRQKSHSLITKSKFGTTSAPAIKADITKEDALHAKNAAPLAQLPGVKQSKASKVNQVISLKIKILQTNRYEHIYKEFSDIFSAVHEAAKAKNVAVDEVACINHHIKQLDIWRDTMQTYLNSFSKPNSKDDENGDTSYVDGLYFEVHQCKGRHEVVDIVTRACAERIGKWHPHPSNIGLQTRTWNLLWTWSRPRIKYESLFHFQRVNHFPGSRELTPKGHSEKKLASFHWVWREACKTVQHNATDILLAKRIFVIRRGI